MTLEEWEKLGTEKFGPDKMQWKFKCPVCGHVASAQDYKDAGAPEEAAAFACVGRYLPEKRRAFNETGKKETIKSPCDYKGDGYIRLNPLRVEDEYYFDFA
jgi:hypothetical protein